jgi:chromosome segregation ATPase
MNNSLLQDFIDRYNKDKEEFNRKFETINYKLKNIDKKFDDFDQGLQKVNGRLGDIEDAQSMLFGQLGGFKDKLDNVKVYLSSIETKLNEYQTLDIQGEKVIDGELYLLKIKLQKVKPIVSWENDKLLSNKYKEIEQKVLELEDSIGKPAV